MRRLLPLLTLLLLVSPLLYEPARASLGEAWGYVVVADLGALRAWAADRGAWAPLVMVVLMVAQAIAAPVPALAITATNALLFGWLAGALLSLTSATVAAALCWWIGATWGEPVARKLVGEGGWARAQERLERSGFAVVLVARLVPVVPFDPISYVAGVAGMRLAPFVVATALGQIPASIVYSLLAARGAEGRLGPRGLLIALGVAALAGVLAVRLRRR